MSNKIARAIEQRDEAKDEQLKLHREMEELRFNTANTPEHQKARRKRDQKTIEKLKLQVSQKDMAIKSLEEKYDFREEQLKPWLRDKVKEHEDVGFTEPLPKLIQKLQHYEPLPSTPHEKYDQTTKEKATPVWPTTGTTLHQ